jgi:hypothetical protein
MLTVDSHAFRLLNKSRPATYARQHGKLFRHRWLSEKKGVGKATAEKVWLTWWTHAILVWRLLTARLSLASRRFQARNVAFEARNLAEKVNRHFPQARLVLIRRVNVRRLSLSRSHQLIQIVLDSHHSLI